LVQSYATFQGCFYFLKVNTHFDLPVLRIRDVYPGSGFFSHPGSKNSNKERGEKKKFCHTFLCSHKFHKIENYFFEVLKKKFGPIFKELKNFLPKKLSLSSQKYGFGIRDPEKTYPGNRGQKGTGSRIRISNTAIYFLSWTLFYFPYLIERISLLVSRRNIKTFVDHVAV
jgi:hypothetical protein